MVSWLLTAFRRLRAATSSGNASSEADNLVTPFDARLLAIARAFARLAPAEPANAFVSESIPAQVGLTANCLEQLRETLSVGSVNYLAQHGWRRERFLQNGKPVTGRLWERWPRGELRLVFTQGTYDFLVWVTSEPPGSTSWKPKLANLSIADQFVMFLGYECLRDTDAGIAWRTHPAFAHNPLCRLMFASDFVTPPSKPLDFSPWVVGLGAAIVESLQRSLMRSWLRMEHGKRQISDWSMMRELAGAQDAVIERFLSVAESAGRLDLTRFLLWSATEYNSADRAMEDIIGGLIASTPLRLAERYEIQRSAGLLSRALIQWRKWQRRARAIGYFDDGYAAAQMLLSDWEAARGDSAYLNAQRLMRELEPATASQVGMPS